MTEEREPKAGGPDPAEPETTEPVNRAPTFLDGDPDTTSKYGDSKREAAVPTKPAPTVATDKYGAEPVRPPAKPAIRPETEVATKVFDTATAPTVKAKLPLEPVDDTEEDVEPPAKPEPAVKAKRASEPPAKVEAPTRAATPSAAARREAPSVYVVGFWKRLVAATVDLAIVIPAALLMTLIVSKIAGVHLPPSNLKVLDVDMWIDLVLATDPALVMGMGMVLAIGLTYLLVFHIVVGRTLGMRLMRIKIIDVYGERPSPARCVARCGGYVAGVATLFLGFLWMGFDSEKRGLQDWIAGTYVIRA